MTSRQLAFAFAAAFAAACPAFAQTDAQPAPSTAAPQPADPAAEAGNTGLDPLDPGIEVSLGRPEIKEQVAQAMGLTAVDVPLTIRVTLELAKRVCGQEVFDSQLDTNRSCTATAFAPELAEAARQSLPTEANELTGSTPPSP